MHSNNNDDFQARAALYALGALSQAEARTFEDDLARASDEARAEAASFNEISAQLGLSVEASAPPASLRTRLLERIASEPQPTPKVVKKTAPKHLDVFANEGDWIPLFTGGSCKILFTEPSNGYITSLLKLEAGARLPNHHHRGNEQCMVMSGEFYMNGKMYNPGDFTVALDGSDHLDVYTPSGGVLMIVSPPSYEIAH
ncbi:MAG: cupin domain-containing protein [Acidobacteria bacterium]|nr:cupin domain-containing protein [Acidobacteriota bacterium]